MTNKLVPLLVLSVLPIFSFAQADSVKKSKVSKKQHSTKQQKPQLTPEEKKKAAIKRTLKEKNFHLPDTSAHHKK